MYTLRNARGWVLKLIINEKSQLPAKHFNKEIKLKKI